MAEPVSPFALAEIVVVPTATFAAIPVTVPMFATLVFEELQVAVTALPELSFAENVRVDPEAAVKFGPVPVHPVHEMVRVPPPPEVLTVRVARPLFPLSLAVIVVTPVWFAVASPVLLTLATLDEEEVQVAEELTSLLVPSPNVPVAVNC